MSAASRKQLDLISRLIPEKLDEEQTAAAHDRLEIGLTSETASAWIEKLLGMKSLPPEEGSPLHVAVSYLELRERTGRPSDFEKGLLEQYRQRGSLSPRQIEVCVERVTKLANTTRAQPGQPATETPETETETPLVPAGRYAVEMGTEDNPITVLVRVWRGSRNPDVQHVYSVQGTEKGERITDDDVVARIVSLIAQGPAKAAIAFGHRTGHCSKCGLALDVNLTRYMGIGPVCIKQYADDETRLELTWKAREELRAAGIDPKGHNDDLSAVTAATA